MKRGKVTLAAPGASTAPPRPNLVPRAQGGTRRSASCSPPPQLRVRGGAPAKHAGGAGGVHVAVGQLALAPRLCHVGAALVRQRALAAEQPAARGMRVRRRR